ncbi:AMP-binding protein [Kitasatospora sp. NPDC058162]|uniref:AMP-binding protein n=1 Tax=Kitasatospora sp. NPDC058162 TaxID=3346362 RepID=UPI0036DB9801
MALIHILTEAIGRHRAEVAVVEGEESHTYGELDALSARMAGGLRERGVGSGDLVAVYATRSWLRCAAVLAAWRVGAGVVSLDPGLPRPRTERILRGAGAALLVREDGSAETGFDLAECAFGDLGTGTGSPELAEGPIAYVIPTSGSTGEPKSVAVPPVVLEALAVWHREHWVHDVPPHTLHAASIGFDVVYEDMVSTWLVGARLVMVDDQQRRDAFELVPLIRRHEVARLFMPVGALHGMAMVTTLGGESIPSVREIAVAGEQLVINDEVREMCGDGRIRLVNQYGPSETHVITQHRLDGDTRDWPDRPPIGVAVVGAELLCAEDGRVRPYRPGETAELIAAGDCVGVGYLGDEALTKEKFQDLVHVDGGVRRCYSTGDLVRYDGEVYWFVSRVDDQVKVNGYRVEPGEVEAVLARVAGVRRALVLCVRGQGTNQLAAFYVPQDESVTEADLRDACARELPGYMVPRHFVRMDAFPVNANGKIDRALLMGMV